MRPQSLVPLQMAGEAECWGFWLREELGDEGAEGAVAYSFFPAGTIVTSVISIFA